MVDQATRPNAIFIDPYAKDKDTFGLASNSSATLLMYLQPVRRPANLCHANHELRVTTARPPAARTLLPSRWGQRLVQRVEQIALLRPEFHFQIANPTLNGFDHDCLFVQNASILDVDCPDFHAPWRLPEK